VNALSPGVPEGFPNHWTRLHTTRM
jgi:hypothetical protein